MSAAEQRGHPEDFRDRVARRNVIAVAGPGGVGKTTTSAALAVAAARQGLRVAALTVDPARRLADSMGIPDPGAEPREVERSRWASGAAGVGRLTMMMMDTKTTFDRVVERHSPTAEVRKRILANPIYHHVSSELAGAHEYMAMEKLLELDESKQFDLIVLDTPPTRDALDFLSAPERMVDALDSGFLRRISQSLRPPHGIGSKLLVHGVSRVLAVMARITGRELLDQVAAFVADLNSLFGGFRQRATAVTRAFRSPRFGFSVVCTPRRDPAEEALNLLGHLQAEGMALDALIVNRRHADPADAGTGQPSEALERALGSWSEERRQRLAGRVERARDDAARAAARDDVRITEIRARLAALGGSVPLVSIANLPADRVGIDAVLEIAVALERARWR